MTVETDQKYQETVEAAANILCQMKQTDDLMAISIILCHIKKGHEYLDIPYGEEVLFL